MVPEVFPACLLSVILGPFLYTLSYSHWLSFRLQWALLLPAPSLSPRWPLSLEPHPPLQFSNSLPAEVSAWTLLFRQSLFRCPRLGWVPCYMLWISALFKQLWPLHWINCIMRSDILEDRDMSFFPILFQHFAQRLSCGRCSVNTYERMNELEAAFQSVDLVT